jgi:hypothetical protein
MATTRVLERGLAAVGLLQEASPVFAHEQSVDKAGVLFAVPALIAQGLLKCREVYQELSSGYYGLRSTILTLAFMALCRIKNPEQLKQQKVGELGSLLGLDRVPETRCLRDKIQQIVTQHKAKDFNLLLFNHWLPRGDEFFFYLDGHVRIYYGHKANLTVKYISRQKLCLSATTEYWVNDEQGLPYLVFMGELNEKMQDVIELQIIPELKASTEIAQRIADKKALLFTLVFDRECYQPGFFYRLWDKHQIAVLTYRKNVKDKWEENLFKQYDVQILNNTVTLLLCEQQVHLGGHDFREIRCLGEGGHQTAIITTNADITITQIASKMFCRWSQENFFKYLIADYDFDKMAQYGTQSVDENKKIVNPEYRKITYKIKKISEKIQRLEAKLYTVIEQVNKQDLDHIPALTTQQIKTTDLIVTLKTEKQIWVAQRVDIPGKIMLKEMPEARRFNKLKPESKLFMNVVKMICYRAETALAEMAGAFFYKEKNEKRMLIKQLFNTPADLIPSMDQKTLMIKLASLSAPRYNEAIDQLCTELNQSETIFPGTDLRMIFEIKASNFTKGKEF